MHMSDTRSTGQIALHMLVRGEVMSAFYWHCKEYSGTWKGKGLDVGCGLYPVMRCLPLYIMEHVDLVDPTDLPPYLNELEHTHQMDLYTFTKTIKEPYDIITLVEVLEHLNDWPEQFLGLVASPAYQKGRTTIIITVPTFPGIDHKTRFLFHPMENRLERVFSKAGLLVQTHCYLYPGWQLYTVI